MKLLRSITRRGFTVGTAGWFTVVSPNRWFASSRLPRSSHYLSEEFQTIAGRNKRRHPDQAGSGQAAPPRIMLIAREDRHPIQIALIVLTAIAITAVVLTWIIRAR